MNEKFESFLKHQKRLAAYNAAFALLGWDEETLAPSGATEKTAELEGVLSGEVYTLQTDPEYKALVKELMKDPALSEDERELIRKTEKEIRLTDAIPKELYGKEAVLTSKSMAAWQEAKKKNEYALFLPLLSEMIELKKEIAKCQNEDGRPLYDVLLDQYEEGFTMERLDAFFGLIRKEIVPLLKLAKNGNKRIRTDFLGRRFPVSKQKKFNRMIAEYVGLDLNRAVIGESEHPFTTGLHKDDVRITTKYRPEMVADTRFSTIHESGHAIFEQGHDERYAFVPASSISMGLHESQSRMYENMIGRSEAFWTPLYPKLCRAFPAELGDVTLTEWIRAVNRADATLIRTEADELSYCLHIMVRYEVEKKIFNENYPAEDLPKLWAELYREYLGVDVPDDRQGILQDVHYAGGMFGYFPSYAIGNAIAAQLYQAMDREINVKKVLREGHPEKVKDWLHDRVHVYGGLRTVDRILKDATGEAFDPKHYVKYLKQKFKALYKTDAPVK